MSAERKIETADETSRDTETSLEPFALRQQVAERVAAHRSRRRPQGETDPIAQRIIIREAKRLAHRCRSR